MQQHPSEKQRDLERIFLFVKSIRDRDRKTFDLHENSNILSSSKQNFQHSAAGNCKANWELSQQSTDLAWIKSEKKQLYCECETRRKRLNSTDDLRRASCTCANSELVLLVCCCVMLLYSDDFDCWWSVVAEFIECWIRFGCVVVSRSVDSLLIAEIGERLTCAVCCIICHRRADRIIHSVLFVEAEIILISSCHQLARVSR